MCEHGEIQIPNYRAKKKKNNLTRLTIYWTKMPLNYEKSTHYSREKAREGALAIQERRQWPDSWMYAFCPLTLFMSRKMHACSPNTVRIHQFSTNQVIAFSLERRKIEFYKLYRLFYFANLQNSNEYFPLKNSQKQVRHTWKIRFYQVCKEKNSSN